MDTSDAKREGPAAVASSAGLLRRVRRATRGGVGMKRGLRMAALLLNRRGGLIAPQVAGIPGWGGTLALKLARRADEGR